MYPPPQKIFLLIFGSKQHWPTLDGGQFTSPLPSNFFACFWIEAILSSSRHWAMPPPLPHFFAHFWIKATLANSGCWAMYLPPNFCLFLDQSNIGVMLLSKLNKKLSFPVGSQHIWEILPYVGHSGL